MDHSVEGAHALSVRHLLYVLLLVVVVVVVVDWSSSPSRRYRYVLSSLHAYQRTTSSKDVGVIQGTFSSGETSFQVSCHVHCGLVVYSIP